MNYIIDMKLPSANDYINACRTNYHKAAKMKRETEENIMWFIKKMPRFENPIVITFNWVEANKKRDLDNITFGQKFILDAMQKAGKIPNDNQSHIKGLNHEFTYAHKTYVVVSIQEVKNEQ